MTLQSGERALVPRRHRRARRHDRGVDRDGDPDRVTELGGQDLDQGLPHALLQDLLREVVGSRQQSRAIEETERPGETDEGLLLRCDADRVQGLQGPLPDGGKVILGHAHRRVPPSPSRDGLVVHTVVHTLCICGCGLASVCAATAPRAGRAPGAPAGCNRSPRPRRVVRAPSAAPQDHSLLPSPMGMGAGRLLEVLHRLLSVFPRGVRPRSCAEDRPLTCGDAVGDPDPLRAASSDRPLTVLVRTPLSSSGAARTRGCLHPSQSGSPGRCRGPSASGREDGVDEPLRGGHPLGRGCSRGWFLHRDCPQPVDDTLV